MPMLVLHADAYPFELVIEVLISFIDPRPNLLLYVTVTAVNSHPAYVKTSPQGIHNQPGTNLGATSAAEVIEKTHKKLPGNIRFGGTRMSSKKSRRTSSKD